MFPLEFKFQYFQKRSVKEQRLYDYKDRFFTAIHYLAIILVVSSSFFTGVPYPDYISWNMTQHCDNENFKQPLTPVDKTWAIVTIVIVTCLVVCLMSTRIIIYGWVNKDVLDIMNYFFGFLTLWVGSYVLKNLIGYPIPSFFTNDELYLFYCCQSCPSNTSTKKFTDLDRYSRGAFPSFLICSISYATAFLFVLCTYLDEKKRFATKLLALLVPGGVSLTYSWYLWRNNENHLQDVVGGALFGSFLGAYIARDIFQKNNKLGKFYDNFVSVIIAREVVTQVQRENTDERNRSNEYVINLYSHEHPVSQLQNNINSNYNSTVLNDYPPPYSSLNLTE
ncbi:uncharacterized protein LOC123006589 [Tribolium madens]|uniref:uncharacterized protein LOC123006589 n=1 Tax=Tribolium madens TaxID=41895 RepID=UPI001CF74CF2|nr:uncharacterized protein LOC123006589 [Tribolium madens]